MVTAAENKPCAPVVDNYEGFLDIFRRKSTKFLIDTFPEFLPAAEAGAFT
jgi:hypothetical protein